MTPSRSPAQPPRQLWTARDAFLAAAGFGIVAGVVETVAAVIRARVMHVTLYVGSEMVWQLPLADALIFVLAAVPLVAVGAAWSRLREPRIVLALASGLVAFAGLLLTEKIHIAAEAVLAGGVGIGVARMLAPRAERVRRVLRYAVPGALVTLAALGLAQRWLRAGAEHREIAALPAGPASRPNVLLLVLDTVRAWDMSLYGWGRPTTPWLSEWAKQGTLFQRALAPAPWTTVSHAVIFTGRYPTDLPVGWRTPLDAEYPTLAQVLRNAGYATSGFAGNYLQLGRGTGLSAGFVHYEDYPFQLLQLLRSTTIGGRILGVDRIKALVGRRRMVPGLVASDVNQRFLRWLDGQGGSHPWFAFLNYFDAHGPYLPPVPFDTMYIGKSDPPVDRYWEHVQRAYGRPPVPAGELGEELDAYDGAITYLDLQVDSLLKALGTRGALQNTIVVVTSDHGELFGEHGVVSHGNNLYLPVLHVPLLIVAPGRVPANARIPSLTSLRDLPATLLELTGVANPGLPGHSMAGWLAAGSASASDTLFAAVDYNRLLPSFPPSPLLRGHMRTVVLDSLQYILNGDGVEELYHLGRDSWEVQNLVAAPEYQAELRRYREALGVILRTARPPSASR
jgi:arylsulfatase A-like enzyme